MQQLSTILSKKQQEVIVQQTEAGVATQEIANLLNVNYHTVYYYQRKHINNTIKPRSKTYKKKTSKSIVRYKNTLPAAQTFERVKGQYSNQKSVMGIDYNSI